MSSLPKFDADAALREIRGSAPANPANPAKVRPDSPQISGFSDFSGPRPEFDEIPEERRAWGDELIRDLHRWLSVHEPHVWSGARIWERINPHLDRLDQLLRDYEKTGEDGDRKAAVFASEAVAAAAARAAREWTERNRR